MEGTVFADSEIKKLIRKGHIVTSSKRINTRKKGGQVQPSSLDLRCGFGKTVWHDIETADFSPQRMSYRKDKIKGAFL